MNLISLLKEIQIEVTPKYFETIKSGSIHLTKLGQDSLQKIMKFDTNEFWEYVFQKYGLNWMTNAINDIPNYTLSKLNRDFHEYLKSKK